MASFALAGAFCRSASVTLSESPNVTLWLHSALRLAALARALAGRGLAALVRGEFDELVRVWAGGLVERSAAAFECKLRRCWREFLARCSATVFGPRSRVAFRDLCARTSFGVLYARRRRR